VGRRAAQTMVTWLALSEAQLARSSAPASSLYRFSCRRHRKRPIERNERTTMRCGQNRAAVVPRFAFRVRPLGGRMTFPPTLFGWWTRRTPNPFYARVSSRGATEPPWAGDPLSSSPVLCPCRTRSGVNLLEIGLQGSEIKIVRRQIGLLDPVLTQNRVGLIAIGVQESPRHALQ
jgi:hypothetical protein